MYSAIKFIARGYLVPHIKRIVLIINVFLFFDAGVAIGQITISESDILGAIGNTVVIEQDTSGNITVDVGSPGSDQTWDFRNVNLQNPVSVQFEFLDPSNSLYGIYYPTSNFSERITLSLLPGFEIFNYYAVGNSSYIDVGEVQNLGFDTIFNFRNQLIAPLPVGHNDEWVVVSADTFGTFPVTGFVTTDTSFIKVDGWGTIRVPGGDFSCLRLRLDNKSTTDIYIGGSIVNTTVENFIAYNWIASGYSVIATVLSMEGETDPEFTLASSFTRIIDQTTGLKDGGDNNRFSTSLLQNVPNPFDSRTMIEFHLPESRHITLAVYDIDKKLIEVLADGFFLEGIHKIYWPRSTDDYSSIPTTGVFIYQLTVDGMSVAKKMVRLQ